MNLKKKLLKVKRRTYLKTYTLKESFELLKLHAVTGSCNGFLDFNDLKKAKKLVNKLNKHGLQSGIESGQDYIWVQW